MSYHQLPPQAYTRDTLAQAYEWLHQQPPSIQELATNADALVALYMQSRRRGHSTFIGTSPNPETIVGPASAEAFKNDLKALAEGFRQFESPKRIEHEARPYVSQVPAQQPANYAPQVSTYQASSHQASTHTVHPNVPSKPNAPLNSQPPATIQTQTPAPMSAQVPMATPPQLQTAAPATPAASAMQVADQKMSLPDQKSMEIVREVQRLLNLSREQEALRLLIAIGYDRVRAILPKEPL